VVPRRELLARYDDYVARLTARPAYIRAIAKDDG
jgi:hypothetical protein